MNTTFFNDIFLHFATKNSASYKNLKQSFFCRYTMIIKTNLPTYTRGTHMSFKLFHHGIRNRHIFKHSFKFRSKLAATFSLLRKKHIWIMVFDHLKKKQNIQKAKLFFYIKRKNIFLRYKAIHLFNTQLQIKRKTRC